MAGRAVSIMRRGILDTTAVGQQRSHATSGKATVPTQALEHKTDVHTDPLS